MCKQKSLFTLVLALTLTSLTGCWSSQEIEDLSVYSGMAFDIGKPGEVEQEMEKQGGDYYKKDLVTATVQIIPVKSYSRKSSSEGKQSLKYSNLALTGDSVFDILREYSTRRDRPVIGHHLKVIVISTKLAREQKIEQIMDFMLRDNDIRPSCMVFFSSKRASDTFKTSNPEEIPSLRIRAMTRNRYRTNKVMKEVNLTQLDGLIHSKQSFLMQNIISAQGEIQFSGAGIVKGASGKWIGNLNQENVEGISWIQGTGKGGTIKSYDWRNQPITYEIKSMKSKIKSKVRGDKISFHVSIESEGRLIENWDTEENPSQVSYMEAAEKVFETRLTTMLEHLMHNMQEKYKVEVAGFGKHLRIHDPHTWKKVKDNWDDVFSQVPVTFDINLMITDYGASTH